MRLALAILIAGALNAFGQAHTQRDIPYLGAVLNPSYYIQYVAQADAHNDGSTSATLTLTITNSPSSFTALAVMSRNNHPVTSVVDTLGNTWTKSLSLTNASNRFIWFYYGTNMAAGSNQITVTISVTDTFWSARAYHFTGVQLGNPQDQQTSASGTGGAIPYTISSGSITPGFNGELVIGTCIVDAGSIDPDIVPGWTHPSGFNVAYPGLHYYIQTNAAAITSYFTNTTVSTDLYNTIVTSFKHR
jgi:hypothetical protein